MTDKVQKIREEVERMHNLLPVVDGDNIYINYADRICTTLEMYIDSLQEEPVSEDLNEAAIVYNKKANFVCAGEIPNEHFIAGAQWQKQKDLKEALDSDALTIAHMNGVEKGKKIMREKMMKEAIDFTVIEHEWNGDTLIPVKGLHIDEKVKLIIIKEE